MPVQITKNFQYPRTDRTGCNGLSGPGTGRGSSPFSILGRIERDATVINLTNPDPLLDFQYPRTDRTGCNGRFGNEGLRVWWTFSILGRIERDATRSRSGTTSTTGALSVSSDGSNGMQQAYLGRAAEAIRAFQYPRTDRTGCNSVSWRTG